MVEEKPNYYAVIPAEVRYDENLKPMEKLLYGEITALTYKTGECWASNNYFARLYKTTPQGISRWILNLQKFGYVAIDYEYKGKEIKKRIIKVSTHIDTYQHTLRGYQHTVKENNTSINNTSIKKEIYKERKFKKPTLEEVQDYCNERNNNVDPQRFIDFYESKDWYIGKNKMKDWKACVRTWERNNKKEAEVPSWFDKDLEVQAPDEDMDTLLKELTK